MLRFVVVLLRAFAWIVLCLGLLFAFVSITTDAGTNPASLAGKMMFVLGMLLGGLLLWAVLLALAATTEHTLRKPPTGSG